jgi:glucosylceramidase
MVTAAKNPDVSIAVVLLNMDQESKQVELLLNNKPKAFSISPQAIQTIIVPSNLP